MNDVTGSTPTAVPAAPDDESRFKSWLRERYQIEDDPDTFKQRVGKWRRDSEEELPRHANTLTALVQYVQQQQHASQTVAPRDTKGEFTEEELRELVRLDPYTGTQKMLERERATNVRALREVEERATRRAEGAALAQDAERRAALIVRHNWPEAYDQRTDLFKAGNTVYNREFSEIDRSHPMAFLRATEIAAGRLGVPPVPRRSPSGREASEGQNIRGDRAPRNTSPDAPLTARQRHIAASMGLDEKTYVKAKRARASGQNIEVE